MYNFRIFAITLGTTLTIFLGCLSCTPKPEPFVLGLLALPIAEGATFQVVSTIPSNNQTGVITNSSIIITFSKNVDSASISGNISFSQPGTNSISSLSATTSSRVITLKPNSSFDAASSFSVTLKSGIKSTSADTLGSDYTFSFTTQ